MDIDKHQSIIFVLFVLVYQLYNIIHAKIQIKYTKLKTKKNEQQLLICDGQANIMDNWTHMLICHEKQWSIFFCCWPSLVAKINKYGWCTNKPSTWKKIHTHFCNLVLSIQVTTNHDITNVTCSSWKTNYQHWVKWYKKNKIEKPGQV